MNVAYVLAGSLLLLFAWFFVSRPRLSLVLGMVAMALIAAEFPQTPGAIVDGVVGVVTGVTGGVQRFVAGVAGA